MYEMYLSNFQLHTVIRPLKGNGENIIAMSHKGLFYMGNQGTEESRDFSKSTDWQSQKT